MLPAIVGCVQWPLDAFSEPLDPSGEPLDPSGSRWMRPASRWMLPTSRWMRPASRRIFPAVVGCFQRVVGCFRRDAGSSGKTLDASGETLDASGELPDASKKPLDASPSHRWMADIRLSSLVLPVRLECGRLEAGAPSGEGKSETVDPQEGRPGYSFILSGGTTSTLHGASRVTSAATLPITRRSKPPVP
jgi:hypothetical protein